MSGQQINTEQVNRAGMGMIVGAGLSWWFYSTVTLGQPYDDWLGGAFGIIAGVKAVQFLSVIGRITGRKAKGDRFRKRGSGPCHPSIYPHLPERREPGISDQAAAEESQPLLEQRAQRSQPLTQRFFDRRQHLAPH